MNENIIYSKNEQFTIKYSDDKYLVSYQKECEKNLAEKLINIYGKDINLSFNRKFDNLICYVDCSRNAVMNIKTIKKLIDVISCIGYTQLIIYMEDTYEIKSQPYFGYKRGRYTIDELKLIDDYAFNKGIEVIPCIQTLAHLQTLKEWTEYSPLFDCMDILEVGNEKVYELIEEMIKGLKGVFRSNTIHIGMDEAFLLGRGNYIKHNGYKDQNEVFKYHLNRVIEIVRKYDVKVKVWNDGFMDELIDIPEDIEICYWNYYGKTPQDYQADYDKLKRYKNKKSFYGCSYTHSGIFPENTPAIALLDAGIEGAINNGIKDIAVTSWGDGGTMCPCISSLPVFFYASQKMYGYSDEILNMLFKELTSLSYYDYYSLESINLFTDNKFNRNNVPTYMIFNDYFIGLCNSTVVEGDENKFVVLEKGYKELIKNKDYGFLFNTAYAFCEVLKYKYTISNRTKKAYLEKDKKTLKKLLSKEYKYILKGYQKLYKIYRTQWYELNKTEGFEVMDIRLGGMIQRTKSCMDRLKDYISGKIDCISELEGPTLGFLGGRENYVSQNEGYGSWDHAYTPSTMSKDF